MIKNYRIINRISGDILEVKGDVLIGDEYHLMDELYEHRHFLFMALCKNVKYSWKSKLHSDGTMFENYFIMGIGRDRGKQITYHLPLEYWDECNVSELERAPEWDGHDSNDVIFRLRTLIL